MSTSCSLHLWWAHTQRELISLLEKDWWLHVVSKRGSRITFFNYGLLYKQIERRVLTCTSKGDNWRQCRIMPCPSLVQNISIVVTGVTTANAAWCVWHQTWEGSDDLGLRIGQYHENVACLCSLSSVSRKKKTIWWLCTVVVRICLKCCLPSNASKNSMSSCHIWNSCKTS